MFGSNKSKNKSIQQDSVQVNNQKIEKLTYALSQLRGIVNSLANPIFAFEFDGSIYYFSQGASKILKKALPAVIGRKFFAILPLEPKDQLRQMYSDFIDNKQKLTGEFTGPHDMPIELVISPIQLGPGGVVNGGVVEIVDLTQKKEFQQRQIDFISFISHELRTPISSAKGYLDVVLHEADYLKPDHKKFLERAMASTQRQADTVEKLIDLSNLERGQMIVTFEEIDIIAQLQDVINYWRDVASKKSLKLNLLYPKFNIPHVKADVTLLRTILNNLLDNATKYTKQGSIEVSVHQKESFVYVSIKDTGPGIAENIRKEVFEKFVRGEHSMTETTQGSGLGLYLAKRFTEQMGGKLTLETQLDKGSTFTFSLPLF